MENAKVSLTALLSQAISLLQEMVNDHADPECWQYNGCDQPGEQCKWCEEAKKLICYENRKGGEERAMKESNDNTRSDNERLDSNALFAFLREHGGSLFQRDAVDGRWQYSLHVEGREGRSRLTYSVGDTPEEAIQNHDLFEANDLSEELRA